MWARTLDVGSYLNYLNLNALTIVSNLTSVTRDMGVIVLLGVYLIVPFMKAVTFVVVMMGTASPRDMKTATITTLAPGCKKTLPGGTIVRQNRDSWAPEQDIEAECSFADKSALTRH